MMAHRKYSLIDRLQSWGILACAGMLIAFGIGAVIPIPIIQVKNIQIENSPVKRGQILEYSVHFRKFLPLPAKVTKTLINGVVIPSEPCTSNAPIGEHTVSTLYHVPNTLMVVGKRKLRISYEYDLGFRVITYTYETPTFEVVE